MTVLVLRGLGQLFIHLHQFDPEVGDEKEQQQGHGQEDATEQEPAGELSHELRQHWAHGRSR